MLLCYFLRAEESKKFCKVKPCKKGLGGIPRQGRTLQKEEVLGQAKRAELERGLLVTPAGFHPAKRGGMGDSPHPRARSRNYFLIKLAIETNMVASDAIEVPMPSH